MCSPNSWLSEPDGVLEKDYFHSNKQPHLTKPEGDKRNPLTQCILRVWMRNSDNSCEEQPYRWLRQIREIWEILLHF